MVDLTDQTTSNLTSVHAQGNSCGIWKAAWSPDHNKVAFTYYGSGYGSTVVRGDGLFIADSNALSNWANWQSVSVPTGNVIGTGQQAWFSNSEKLALGSLIEK